MMVFDLSKKDFIYFLDILPNDFIVMIYFEMETKLALVKRFYDVLRPGGYLFIGHAESIPRDSTDYEYIKPAIYRRPLK